MAPSTKAWESTVRDTGVTTRGRGKLPNPDDNTPTRRLYNVAKRRRERSPVIREPRCRRLPDSPEVDANAMYDQINLVGSTTQLPEDTEVSETETGAAVVKADQVGSTPVVEESSSAANSEYSVDLDGIDKASAAKLKADAKKASQDVAVSQLIAAVALQALVLPNPGGEY
jgi:hypothetical protein